MVYFLKFRIIFGKIKEFTIFYLDFTENNKNYRTFNSKDFQFYGRITNICSNFSKSPVKLRIFLHFHFFILKITIFLRKILFLFIKKKQKISTFFFLKRKYQRKIPFSSIFYVHFLKKVE